MDNRTPLDLFSQFCEQLRHHWNKGDGVEYVLPVAEALQERTELIRQRDEAHDAAQTLVGALNAAYAHIAADRQAVEQVISSLSDHTCGDMEFCQKTNKAFVLLYEVLERTAPPADAAQVVASRMDAELEAFRQQCMALCREAYSPFTPGGDWSGAGEGEKTAHMLEQLIEGLSPRQPRTNDEELEALAVLAEEIGDETHEAMPWPYDGSEYVGKKIAAEIRARKRGGRVT